MKMLFLSLYNAAYSNHSVIRLPNLYSRVVNSVRTPSP